MADIVFTGSRWLPRPCESGAGELLLEADLDQLLTHLGAFKATRFHSPEAETITQVGWAAAGVCRCEVDIVALIPLPRPWSAWVVLFSSLHVGLSCGSGNIQRRHEGRSQLKSEQSDSALLLFLCGSFHTSSQQSSLVFISRLCHSRRWRALD